MRLFFQQPARSLLRPVAALSVALGLIALVLLALGADPLKVLGALLNGAAGNRFALSDTIVKATPLVFTGLAISIAFQAALWNIGAEGQLLAGALVAVAIGAHMDGWPRPVAIIVVLLAGTCAGAFWGAMAGWLKARRGVDEVISTIMLNFVALEIVSWAVHGPLMEASRAYPTSEPIAPSAELYTFFSPTRLNAGMILAVVLAIFCYHLLFFTEAGFKLRTFGKSRRASAFFGIGTGGLTIATMAFSGALAGLGGAVQLSAINHRLYERFSPGWGFEAIAVALVARLNPLGILISALLFGALDNGAQAMQRSVGVSPVLVQVIQGMVIFVLLAFDAAGLSELRQKIFSQVPPQASTAALTGDAANA